MRLLVASLLAALVVAAASGPAAAAPPEITAAAAIVIDAGSGEVLFERAADERRAMASTAKLMTALLVLERGRMSETVTAARYRALPIESKIGLRAGERMTVADLLRGLLIASANDAAVTLAEHVAGSRPAFVRAMNRRAAELGLGNTRFANPIGLDAARSHSSARDLAKLTVRLREFPFFRRVVDMPTVTLRSGARQRTIHNRNLLVRRTRWIDGVKTGRTQEAGYVLVGSGTRRGVSLVSVVLGTPTEDARNVDTLKLLRYGFGKYRHARAVRRGQVLKRVPIRYRPGALLDLMASREVRRSIRRDGEGFELELVGVPEEVVGPIREGQRFGTIEIFYEGLRVSRVPLVSASDVAEAGVARRVKEYFTRPKTVGLIALVLLASVLATSLRRRSQGRERQRPQRREVEVA